MKTAGVCGRSILAQAVFLLLLAVVPVPCRAAKGRVSEFDTSGEQQAIAEQLGHFLSGEFRDALIIVRQQCHPEIGLTEYSREPYQHKEPGEKQTERRA